MAMSFKKPNMDPFAIHSAVEKGDLHRVRQLIEAGASLDIRNAEGRTPLVLAACMGHRAVVEFLINEGAIGLFLEQDEDDYTLLHQASAHGWADIAQTIIEKGSQSYMVNAATKEDGTTPLMEAACFGNEDVAALLLRSGADVNRRDATGCTALHNGACNGYGGMVKLLLQEEGLDLNPQDEDGRTPLHEACRTGRYREGIITQLLVAGADANLSDRNGDTPLSIYLPLACTTSVEIINLFVQHRYYFQDLDYPIILRNPVLKENVLKNVGLCTQSVINKFSYQTLPALYSSPYFASLLPPMDTFMLNTSQKDDLKNFVSRDIQQNTFCNVVAIRPTALSALCIQCLATYITSRQ